MAPSTATRSAHPRRSDGRERLLDTAERLFAARGITGVSLREITEAAGQRNASVVQYHFGSRDGLVSAIVQRHMATVDADRASRLDDAVVAGEPIDVHTAMRILVEPLAACLTSTSGRCYLRIVQHLVDMPVEVGAEASPLTTTNASLRRVGRLLADATRDLPRTVRVEREAQTTSFLLRALADRAALVEGGGRARRTTDALFIANLVDVLVAVLTSPPSSATAALAGRGR